jgi:hypothetical protein
MWLRIALSLLHDRRTLLKAQPGWIQLGIGEVGSIGWSDL